MKRSNIAALLAAMALFPAFAQAQTVATGVNATVGNTTVGTGTTAGVDWQSENNYWRGSYAKRPYYNSSHDYNMYEPAYRYGVETYSRNTGRRYEDLSQEELERGWTQVRGNSNLNWSDAQLATRDAYNRLYTSGSAGVTTSATSGR